MKPAGRFITETGKHAFPLLSALIFVASAILTLSAFFNPVYNKSFNGLFITGLLVITVLSFILFCYVVKKKFNSKNDHNQAFFQLSPDALIIYNKESREIIEVNANAAALFELEDAVTLKGLYLSQLMMRYLKANSINLDLLMNDIPDNWAGYGNFKTNQQNEFTGYLRNISYQKENINYQLLSITNTTTIPAPQAGQQSNVENLDNPSKTKTRFLSSISHELRTPLNGIIGTSNLILSEKGIPENVKVLLNQQLYSSEHMLCIINDILDFSKIESGKMEINKQPFNLLDALNYLVKSFENQFSKNKVELIFNYDPGLEGIYVESDVVKLRQVLYNLLSNALKFTLQGNVTLLVLIENEGDNDVSILFKIKDTGIGIKKEKQREIFESFAQVHDDDLKRRFGGTGLGLTISEKLVNLFGSSIKVESDLGKGACFYFTLNFKTDNKQPELFVETTAAQPVIDIRGVRVLVVEDNEVNVSILERFLQKWGIRMKEATNGLHALELLKFHKFDLILMDLEMPEMNGYDAVKIIRQTDSEIPIVAFTATLLDNMGSLITNDGFSDYILKPFRPADLKSKIEKFAPNRKIEYA
jgi:signal transduction histidine kinase/CheY-like chemotaxis protein